MPRQQNEQKFCGVLLIWEILQWLSAFWTILLAGWPNLLCQISNKDALVVELSVKTKECIILENWENAEIKDYSYDGCEWVMNDN